MKMENKIVLLTGGNSGVGQCAVRLFTEEGAIIIALDLRTDWLDEFSREHSNVISKCVDVTDKAKINEIVDETIKKYGRIDH